MNDVQCHEITNGGISTYQWLCAPCVEKRRAAGWTVKVGMPLPDASRCGDCTLAEQAAPGYVTPTVAFIATTSDPPPRRRPTTKTPQQAPAGMFDESEAA